MRKIFQKSVILAYIILNNFFLYTFYIEFLIFNLNSCTHDARTEQIN